MSGPVTRFVIDSGTALQLATRSTEVSPEHELYAPTLWRSETLSTMYEAVRRGEIAAEVAREQLAFINRLKIGFSATPCSGVGRGW